MSSPFGMHSLSGFYKAPVTKGLISVIVAGTCAVHCPPSTLRNVGIANYISSSQLHAIRIIMQRVFFWNIKDVMCGCLLLYYFRVFERRYGSHKYANTLLANFVISQMFHMMLIYISQSLHYPLSDLPFGPYGMIFAMFPAYFTEIPAIAYTEILNIFPVTGKTLTYLIALQMVASSKSVILAALCGLVSSLMYRSNVLYVKKWLAFPKFLTYLSSKLFDWLLSSSPPTDDTLPMGATLDLQRQQQLEQLEMEVMMRGRVGRAGDQPLNNINQAANRGWMWRQPTLGGSRNILSVQPSQENITRLVEMGFERAAVVDALRQSNNDVNVATNVLVQHGQ